MEEKDVDVCKGWDGGCVVTGGCDVDVDVEVDTGNVRLDEYRGDGPADGM